MISMKTIKFISILGILLFLNISCRLVTVDPGQVYRSPQPTAEHLENYIQNYGIKTVINLRGENPSKQWWIEEHEIVKKYDLTFINISMSAKHLPHRKNLIKLLDAYKTAPRPILIHCLAGVDRTGEATAIYQMLYMGKSKEEALKMLTPEYGYFEKFKPAKKYFIEHVWQDENWAYEQYNPCLGQYKFYDTHQKACL